MNTIKRIHAAIAAAYRWVVRVLGGGGSGQVKPQGGGGSGPPTLPK